MLCDGIDLPPNFWYNDIMSLTSKQKAFVEEYLCDFNATRAAERAGYGGADNVLGAQGSRLLKNVNISKKIKERLAESAMSADEVLMRLSEMARGEHGKYIKPDGCIDLDQLIADGKGYLIKGTKETKYGLQIEFYDAQHALVDIGRAHGIFRDRIEADITSGGEPFDLAAWREKQQDYMKELEEFIERIDSRQSK